MQNKRDSLSYLISSLTPRLARKLFIEVHDVSKMPIKRNTPSKISRIVSGGALSERISARASLRMSETAARASAKSGSISAISRSMPFLLQFSKTIKDSVEMNCGKQSSRKCEKVRIFTDTGRCHKRCEKIPNRRESRMNGTATGGNSRYSLAVAESVDFFRLCIRTNGPF